MNAVITSNMECCLINIVDKIIKELIIKEPIFIFLFDANALLWITAKNTPKELYTWILGHKFVDVSMWYKENTSFVKILFLGIMNGRKCCILGKNVDTIKNIVIPVKRKVHDL